MLAIHANCMDVVKLLLRQGADPNATRLGDGATALMYAYQITLDRKHFIPILLAYGAAMDIPMTSGRTFSTSMPQDQLEAYKVLAKETRRCEIVLYNSFQGTKSDFARVCLELLPLSF